MRKILALFLLNSLLTVVCEAQGGRFFSRFQSRWSSNSSDDYGRAYVQSPHGGRDSNFVTHVPKTYYGPSHVSSPHGGRDSNFVTRIPKSYYGPSNASSPHGGRDSNFVTRIGR